MILSLMIYAVIVSALIAIAAEALHHIAAVRGWPKRFIWLGVIIAIVVWPIVSRLLSPRPSSAASLLPFSVSLPPLRVVAGEDTVGVISSLDEVLVIGWLVASCVLFARLVIDVLMLRRARRAWPVREIDGHRTRLSVDVGPAVVGLRSMELVVPQWLLCLDEPLRALVLQHEEEHRVARDPHLLITARLATVLMPWNPALWYVARRLRLAIELDCDARVLRTDPSPRRYGLLLLTIAQRRATLPTALSPMLSESTSQLERRIIAMRPVHHRLTRITTLAAALIAVAALALACSVQSDAPPTASRGASAARAAGPSRVVTPGYFEFQVEKRAAPLPDNPPARYPDALRKAKVEGEVVAQFVIDTTGRVEPSTFKVLKSSNSLFTKAVRSYLSDMKFFPAEVGGRKVKQLIQMPFVFSLHRNSQPSR